MKRRELLTGMMATPLMAGSLVQRKRGSHVKLALNAYSFNKPLMDGSMKLAEVIDFCAENELDGVDLTGY